MNVWTPGLRDGKKRPVLFYIHGGAYNNGTVNCDLYDGNRLCHRGDVVVVTVNHRLNAFGYMYLGELGGKEYADSGNAGMLDIVLALKWVQQNIAEFGGDASRVLIFGQSGGGAKCATLMAMPAAKGLFHRVVTMSGQQVTAKPTVIANEVTKDVLDKLGVKYDQLDALKTIADGEDSGGGASELGVAAGDGWRCAAAGSVRSGCAGDFGGRADDSGEYA